MSKKKTARPPSTTTKADRVRDRRTDELIHGAALTAAYRAVPDGLTFTGLDDDSEILAKICFHIGMKYFDIQKADLWLSALRTAIRIGRALPEDAKAALLEMVDQIEHEFFGPYIGAAIVTGVAAGLKGYGADIVREPQMAGGVQ
jgi:hypothetical protein